jgi:hypothetical protein
MLFHAHAAPFPGKQQMHIHLIIASEAIHSNEMESPWVPCRCTASSKSFISHIIVIDGSLVPLVEKPFPNGWSAWRRKVIVHIQDTLARNSRTTQKFLGHNLPKRLLGPFYSHDIFSAGFSLFGNGKNTLIGLELLDEIDLLEAVPEILIGISDAELQCAFPSRIERVERAMNAVGDF